jgi:DNA-binding transcriptional regulator YdaS (Cro superfamily)
MNETTDTPLKALEEAIKKVDGVTNLAARIGRGQSTVSMWLTRAAESPKEWKVPADACPAIERETGVRCERLHPGAAWEVLRMQAIDTEPERKAA